MERWYEPADGLSIFDRLRRPLVSRAPEGVIADEDLARQLVDDRADALIRIMVLEGSVRSAIAEAKVLAQITDDPARVRRLAMNLIDFLRKDLGE